MGASTAVLKYGTYQFDPVPQVGIRRSAAHIGEARTGPGTSECVVTLVGKVKGENLNQVQTKWWALKAALAKDAQTLYWHDGTTLRINQAAKVDGPDTPPEWGQYEQTYTIRFLYWPLDDVRTAPATVSYAGFTFCTAAENAPWPVFGREVTVERPDPDGARSVVRVRVSLVGFFEEGSITANLAKLDALKAALATDGGTLTYGPFVQAVKIDGFSHTPDTMDRRVAYQVTFSYVEGSAGGYEGVSKIQTSLTITRVGKRYVRHYVPFSDYPSIQDLGRTGQTVTFTGSVTADTVAHARLAAIAEIASAFPAGGYEDPGSHITEAGGAYDEHHKVDFNIVKFYLIPVFTGSLYGS
jgi:hypothetical protein